MTPARARPSVMLAHALNDTPLSDLADPDQHLVEATLAGGGEALASYHLVERPVMRFGKRFRRVAAA